MKEEIHNLLNLANSDQKDLVDLAIMLSWNYNESVRRAVEIIQELKVIQKEIESLPNSQIVRDSTTGRMYGKSIVSVGDMFQRMKLQFLEQELQKLKDNNFNSKQLLLLPSH